MPRRGRPGWNICIHSIQLDLITSGTKMVTMRSIGVTLSCGRIWKRKIVVVRYVYYHEAISRSPNFGDAHAAKIEAEVASTPIESNP